MEKRTFHSLISLLALLFVLQTGFAQDPVILPGGVRRPPTNNPSAYPQNGPLRRTTDTTVSNVERRDYSDDSLQVEVYHMNTVKPTTLDTTITDYTTRFPIPSTHVYLGNDGSATRSLFLISCRVLDGILAFMVMMCTNWRLKMCVFTTRRSLTRN